MKKQIKIKMTAQSVSNGNIRVRTSVSNGNCTRTKIQNIRVK